MGLADVTVDLGLYPELKSRLALNPKLKQFSLTARDLLPGDMFVGYGPLRDVVRVYPYGQSGDATFMEIGLGSVAVCIYPDEPITVFRDPNKELKLKRTHSEDGNRCIRIELAEGP